MSDEGEGSDEDDWNITVTAETVFPEKAYVNETGYSEPLI
jgi:hypothetical protein